MPAAVAAGGGAAVAVVRDVGEALPRRRGPALGRLVADVDPALGVGRWLVAPRALGVPARRVVVESELPPARPERLGALLVGVAQAADPRPTVGLLREGGRALVAARALRVDVVHEIEVEAEVGLPLPGEGELVEAELVAAGLDGQLHARDAVAVEVVLELQRLLSTELLLGLDELGVVDCDAAIFDVFHVVAAGAERQRTEEGADAEDVAFHVVHCCSLCCGRLTTGFG